MKALSNEIYITHFSKIWYIICYTHSLPFSIEFKHCSPLIIWINETVFDFDDGDLIFRQQCWVTQSSHSGLLLPHLILKFTPCFVHIFKLIFLLACFWSVSGLWKSVTFTDCHLVMGDFIHHDKAYISTWNLSLRWFCLYIFLIVSIVDRSQIKRTIPIYVICSVYLVWITWMWGIYFDLAVV
jgi:hypothetical protein